MSCKRWIGWKTRCSSLRLLEGCRKLAEVDRLLRSEIRRGERRCRINRRLVRHSLGEGGMRKHQATKETFNRRKQRERRSYRDWIFRRRLLAVRGHVRVRHRSDSPWRAFKAATCRPTPKSHPRYQHNPSVQIWFQKRRKKY